MNFLSARIGAISVDWEKLEGMDPRTRALAAADLQEQAADLLEQLALLRGQAVAEMAQGMTPGEIARALHVSQARVSQLLGDSGRPDGILLDLLRQGVRLAAEYGAGTAHEGALLRALETLGKPGRRSESQARGIAADLAAISDGDVSTADMNDTERKTWQRALSHAREITNDVPREPGSEGEPR